MVLVCHVILQDHMRGGLGGGALVPAQEKKKVTFWLGATQGNSPFCRVWW